MKAQKSVVSVGETGPSFQKQEAKKNQPHGTAYMDFPVLNARLTACLNSNNAVLPLLLQMWKPKDKEERPQRVKVTQVMGQGQAGCGSEQASSSAQLVSGSQKDNSPRLERLTDLLTEPHLSRGKRSISLVMYKCFTYEQKRSRICPPVPRSRAPHQTPYLTLLSSGVGWHGFQHTPQA